MRQAIRSFLELREAERRAPMVNRDLPGSLTRLTGDQVMNRSGTDVGAGAPAPCGQALCLIRRDQSQLVNVALGSGRDSAQQGEVVCRQRGNGLGPEQTVV